MDSFQSSPTWTTKQHLAVDRPPFKKKLIYNLFTIKCIQFKCSVWWILRNGYIQMYNLFNHQHSKNIDIPKSSLIPNSSQLCPTQLWAIIYLFFSSYLLNLSFIDFYINQTRQYELSLYLCSLSIIFFEIHFIEYINSSFLFITK